MACLGRLGPAHGLDATAEGLSVELDAETVGAYAIETSGDQSLQFDTVGG
jgi:hypothetical protein